jgi:hypothetical protein
MKIIAAAGLIAVSAVGAWMLMQNRPEPETVKQESPGSDTAKKTNPAQKPAAAANGSSAGQDSEISENASIDEDLSEIDAQLKALEDDGAVIDQSLNDSSETPVSK